MSAPARDEVVVGVHRRLVDAAVPLDQVAAAARRLVRSEHPLLPADAVEDLVAAVAARAAGLGPLDPLLADPGVTDVLVNGAGPVWVECGGELVATDVRLDAEAVGRLVERIVAPLGLRADRRSPLVDARLPDGSRVHAVLPPLAVDGPCLTIRRFGARPVPLAAFAPPPVVELLERVVAERRNVVVSGGTGAGKTTLLNALAATIPAHERIVTIEDAAELRLPGDHVVRLESRPPNADGVGAVPVRELVRNALRMRPDRIVVGEVRGGEALDMLQAMNTGHEGSLSTCHANGADDALRRLETLALLAGVELPLAAVREQLAAAVDVVVQVARRPGGGRAVVAVAEPEPDAGGARTRPVADRDGVVGELRRPPRWAR